MADREKVIKGLEMHEKKRARAGVACLECPYAEAEGGTDDWCIRGLHRDILAMLKEQEPRLITLEEVKNHNNKDNCVWFELRDIVVIPVFTRQDRQETVIENPYILSDQTISHLYWKNIDYCKKWRCWSLRPTDEQREAVTWDA